MPSPRQKRRKPFEVGRLLVRAWMRIETAFSQLVVILDVGPMWCVVSWASLTTSPGRIFVAYYYTLDDGNGFGGTRFVAGSLFTVM